MSDSGNTRLYMQIDRLQRITEIASKFRGEFTIPKLRERYEELCNDKLCYVLAYRDLQNLETWGFVTVTPRRRPLPHLYRWVEDRRPLLVDRIS